MHGNMEYLQLLTSVGDYISSAIMTGKVVDRSDIFLFASDFCPSSQEYPRRPVPVAGERRGKRFDFQDATGNVAVAEQIAMQNLLTVPVSHSEAFTNCHTGAALRYPS